MISPRLLRYCSLSLAMCLVISPAAAQKRRKSKPKPKPAAAAPPPPTTLQGCGVLLRVPPGWQVIPASAPFETTEASAQPTAIADGAKPIPTEPSDTDASASKPAEAVPPPPCSFVLSSKAPSELVQNTATEGPVGEMELQVVEGTLEAAAPQLFEKDDRGWYAVGSKDTRADAKLSKQRHMQVLSAVLVEGCYDLNGKYRGLCEISKYVYSNGRRNLLITAGPYMGETEFSVLNSIRFTGAPKVRTKKR